MAGGYRGPPGLCALRPAHYVKLIELCRGLHASRHAHRPVQAISQLSYCIMGPRPTSCGGGCGGCRGLPPLTPPKLPIAVRQYHEHRHAQHNAPVYRIRLGGCYSRFRISSRPGFIAQIGGVGVLQEAEGGCPSSW